MQAYLYLNLSREHYFETALKIINKLSSFKDLELFYSLEDAKLLNKTYQVSNHIDFIISIGGDGTFLEASKIALEKDLPIVGINAGRLGFLCKYHLNSFLKLKSNPFVKQKYSYRSILTLEVNNKKHLALNDFVFTSSNAGYTITCNVKCESFDINYQGSGVIISTPTGSTAFNAASCNCIIEANLPVNIITPICPCGKERSSYVVSFEESISIENKRDSDPIDIYGDGKFICELNEKLTVSKHLKQLKIII